MRTRIGCRAFYRLLTMLANRLGDGLPRRRYPQSPQPQLVPLRTFCPPRSQLSIEVRVSELSQHRSWLGVAGAALLSGWSGISERLCLAWRKRYDAHCLSTAFLSKNTCGNTCNGHYMN
jgi:hypothetical protein